MALMLSLLMHSSSLSQVAQWALLLIVVAVGWSYARVAVGDDDREAAKRGAGLLLLVVMLACAAMVADMRAARVMTPAQLACGTARVGTQIIIRDPCFECEKHHSALYCAIFCTL